MAIANVPSRTNVAGSPASSNKVALSVVTTLFFMWGFLTVLNDVLVPHLKSIFDLNYAKVMLIQFAFFLGVFLVLDSFRQGDRLDWIQEDNGGGIVHHGIGSAVVHSCGKRTFLSSVSRGVDGAGGGHHRVAGGGQSLRGRARARPETASSRLNLAQAFNSLGTTIAPYLGGMLILNASRQNMDTVRQMSAEALHAYRVQEASSVKLPYLIIGLTLIAPGSSHRDVQAASDARGGKARSRQDRGRASGTPSPGAGGGGNFRLRGRRSFNRQFPDQLLHPDEHRQCVGSGSGRLCFLLLGRRHGGPVYRFGHSCKSKHQHSAGNRRAGGVRLGDRFDVDVRARRDVEPSFWWACSTPLCSPASSRWGSPSWAR